MNILKSREGVLFASFIVSQPLIDVTTGLATRYVNSVVTPGALIRTLLLLFIAPYIWKELRERAFLRMLFISTVGTIGLTAVLSIVLKHPFLFTQEAVFYMKSLYYVVGLFFIILYVQKNLLSQVQVSRSIGIMSLLIGGSYFLALLTKSSFPSYPSGEIGFSGWFFSANELSVIVLLTFASVLTITRARPSLLRYASLFLLAGAGVLIGTKTAYLGIAVLLGITLIEQLWTNRLHIFRTKQTFVYVLLALLFFSVLPFSPMIENRAQHMELANHPIGLQVDPLINKQPAMNNILSSRQHYVKDIAADFARAPLLRKLFGLGYAGDYKKYPKMIEMDFFEIFFSFGIIGSMLLLLPLLYAGLLIIKHTSLRRENWVLLGGFGLTLAIAAVAGHVLFAPSVMSYVVITASLVEPSKKQVLRM